MKEYFDMQIKPLNEALGETLGVQTIEVEYVEHRQLVPVTVQALGPFGEKVTVKAQNIPFYQALGLNIRGLHDE